MRAVTGKVRLVLVLIAMMATAITGYYAVVFTWMDYSYIGYVKSCRILPFYWSAFCLVAGALFMVAVLKPSQRAFALTSVFGGAAAAAYIWTAHAWVAGWVDGHWVPLREPWQAFLVLGPAVLVLGCCLLYLHRRGRLDRPVALVLIWSAGAALFSVWYAFQNYGLGNGAVLSWLLKSSPADVLQRAMPPKVFFADGPFRLPLRVWRYIDWRSSPLCNTEPFFISAGIFQRRTCRSFGTPTSDLQVATLRRPVPVRL